VLKHIQSTDEWNEKSLGAKGFTLIELLVVIVILGILAAVVVFAVGGITDRGKTSACKTDKRTLLTAGEAYIAQKSPTADVSEAALVAASFLNEQSDLYDVTVKAGPPATVEVTSAHNPDNNCT
jgi:general secretion pathway protein G